jgi:hypothetical protein
VSLPAPEQRVLDEIDGTLGASDPQLSSMYAIFTRLSGDEQVTREKLKGGRLRWPGPGSVLYAILLIPVMFGAVIIGILAGGSARGVVTCKAGYAAAAGRLAVPAGGAVPPSRYLGRTAYDQELSPPARDASAMAGAPSGVC